MSRLQPNIDNLFSGVSLFAYSIRKNQVRINVCVFPSTRAMTCFDCQWYPMFDVALLPRQVLQYSEHGGATLANDIGSAMVSINYKFYNRLHRGTGALHNEANLPTVNSWTSLSFRAKFISRDGKLPNFHTSMATIFPVSNKRSADVIGSLREKRSSISCQSTNILNHLGQFKRIKLLTRDQKFQTRNFKKTF